jgi:hypothetical protein
MMDIVSKLISDPETMFAGAFLLGWIWERQKNSKKDKQLAEILNKMADALIRGQDR